MRTPCYTSRDGPPLLRLATIVTTALLSSHWLATVSGAGWDTVVSKQLGDRHRRSVAFLGTPTRRACGEKRSRLPLAASDDGNDESSSPLFAPKEDSDLPAGFNPFDRQPLSSERRIDSPTLMSIRKIKMKKVMEDLMRNANNDKAMDDVLLDNEEFLCEQLNDEDAALDMDSIYEPDMGKEERYRKYNEALDERISQARDSNVLKILERMKEFVMSYDERNSGKKS